MTILLFILGLVFLAMLAMAVRALLSLRWINQRITGDRYFALPVAERRALRREVERRARGILLVAGPLARTFGIRAPVIEFRGVSVPAAICPEASMAFAASYRPDARDVFVATQMKCGTTWMQQIVYETLLRGNGDLSDSGHRHMYALSPWIESRGSVSMEDAPRLGRGDHRIVKTHLPTSLCPYSEDARYVYVLRHPVACFASCVDFVRMLTGPLAFSLPEFVDWFTSDAMWWRSWPEHAEGWWRWAEARPNVLFMHYEQMLADLEASVGEVASFLEVPLSPEELARVVEKSRYSYMKEHEEVFEMSPPTPFSTGDGSFFVSGSRDRDGDVGPEEKARIAAFCRERLSGATYPLSRFYPDV